MNVENAARVVRVFVSSPTDVAPERGRVQAVAAKLNREYEGLVHFETVLWEEHFYKADRSFQPQIQRKPDACDVLVSIFWTRIGTALPADFAPHAEREALSVGHRVRTADRAGGVEVQRHSGRLCVPQDRGRGAADRGRRPPPPGADPARCARSVLERVVQVRAGTFQGGIPDFRQHRRVRAADRGIAAAMAAKPSPARPAAEMAEGKRLAFPGLAPFEAEHAAVFFGRDRAIDEARRRLAAAAEARHAVFADRRRQRFGQVVAGARRPDPAPDHAGHRRRRSTSGAWRS